ncbi:MAG: hypothetical protein M1491_03455 [Deltaproteobacteria bacterium]|nr:hypothetical protein [Deltaproteobacteria bacterium]MCL5277828.1 hypothetical protein [Deltaproteobacteria bacterium]
MHTDLITIALGENDKKALHELKERLLQKFPGIEIVLFRRLTLDSYFVTSMHNTKKSPHLNPDPPFGCVPAKGEETESSFPLWGKEGTNFLLVVRAFFGCG